MTLVRSAYTAALRLATPALLAHLARRSRRQTGAQDDRRARLGFVDHDTRRPLWLHAASAGEMQAALPLAAALAEGYPLRLTAFSASGLARAAESLPAVPAGLAPLDLPGAWRRFFARTEPRLLILVETELWPNLLAEAAHRSVPAILVSARVTPQGAHRLGRFPATTRAMLGHLTDVLAQTPEDLERFRALGLPDGRGRVTGNLKEARTIPAAALTQAQTLRAGPLAGHRVWVAGSVREGEETPVAEAARLIHERVPNAVALIVPRHPERAAGFRSALAARGMETCDANALDTPQPVSANAIVVDRLGVLLALYAAADAAFVGGSFAALGGHNLLEPALLGKPVLAGPHLGNVGEQATRLAAAGALFIVADAAALAAKTIALLNDPEAARQAGEAGRESVSRSRALAATLAALEDYLAGPDRLTGAGADSG